MEKDKSNLENKIKKELPSFEPGLSPYNIQNIEAAKARGLRYHPIKKVYVDKDGYPIKDKYGQILG